MSEPRCHEDSLPYRLAAIRECFEESGLLLARHESRHTLINLSERERENGRKAVHSKEITLKEFLKSHDAVPDIESLIPFTRWLTPAKIPKRFSTQMYIYFLPLESGAVDLGNRQLHVPTHDGGIEHTAAKFLHAQQWIDQSLRKEILLFPPQFVLLSLVAPFLAAIDTTRAQTEDAFFRSSLLQRQRHDLRRWVETDGDPPWGEKCISPHVLRKVKNTYMIMGLEMPGPELDGTSREGDKTRAVRVKLDKDIEKGKQRPIPVELCWKEDVLKEIGASAKI